MGAATFVLLAVVVVFAFLIGQAQRSGLETEIADAVQARGGTVVSIERPWFRNGPWLFRGKGQTIMKVIYRDEAGNLCQVWGRTGMFENDIDWDYDDGDYGGGV